MLKLKILPILLAVSILSMQSQSRKQKATLVKIYTTEGKITVRLYDDTPLHKANFLRLVEQKTYEGLLFHRVIKEFMIQGGDPQSRGADSLQILGGGSLGYTVKAEILFPKYYHKRGALAAARTGDAANPLRESSASQFYIVTGKSFSDADLDMFEKRLSKVADTQGDFKYSEEQRRVYKTFGGAPHLDGSYTVFGEVVDGFDVVDKIENVPTRRGDRPRKDIVITRMKVVKK
ncbi:MAG: peptidylprolyl isomerase [Bacteroidota bacterium]